MLLCISDCNVTSRCVLKRDDNSVFNLWTSVDYYMDNITAGTVCNRRIDNGKPDFVIAYGAYDLIKLKCKYNLLGATVGENFNNNKYYLTWHMRFNCGEVVNNKN